MIFLHKFFIKSQTFIFRF